MIGLANWLPDLTLPYQERGFSAPPFQSLPYQKRVFPAPLPQPLSYQELSFPAPPSLLGKGAGGLGVALAFPT